MTELRSVILNDLHCGSEFALKSPNAVIREDGTHSPMNKAQEILYDFYKGLAKKWKNPDRLILNGDLIDGMAWRGHNTHIWSDNLYDQADDSIRLILMFGAKEIFVIRGTPYHTATDGVDMEEYIGQQLGAKMEGTRYSTEIKMINLAPKKAPERIVHVAHHLAGSKWFAYRGTALSRAMSAVMLNESHFIDKNVHEKISGIIRAHNHYYWYSESTSRFMLSAPAWQLPTPFTQKVMPESPSDIGAVQFTFHEDGSWFKEHEVLKPKGMFPRVW